MHRRGRLLHLARWRLERCHSTRRVEDRKARCIVQDRIVEYISTTHGKSAADVVVCGVPGFKGGGGGLYCKTGETDNTFNQMRDAAVTRARAPQDEIDKGKFLLVKSDAAKPGEKAVTCFIIWHEFGHALADRVCYG